MDAAADGQIAPLIALTARVRPQSAIHEQVGTLRAEQSAVLTDLERGTHLSSVEATILARERLVQDDLTELRRHDRELIEQLQAVLDDGQVADDSLASLVVSRLTDNVVVHGTAAGVGMLRTSLAVLQRAAGELLLDDPDALGGVASVLRPASTPIHHARELAAWAVRLPAAVATRVLLAARDLAGVGESVLDRDLRRYRRAKRLADARRLGLFVFTSLVLFELLPNMLIDLLDTGLVSERASHFILLLLSAAGIWLVQERWLNERLDRALLQRQRRDLRASIDVLYDAAVKARCCREIVAAWVEAREPSAQASERGRSPRSSVTGASAGA